MRCPECQKQNDESNRFCGECGQPLPSVPERVSAGEEGLYFCHRHKKETTRVTCGRCERPVCHRCMTVGANGIRCPDCAKNKIPIRWSGVLHDAGRGVSGAAQNLGSRPVWYLYLWSMIVRIIMGFFGR